jgi:hypothetical protein
MHGIAQQEPINKEPKPTAADIAPENSDPFHINHAE